MRITFFLFIVPFLLSADDYKLLIGSHAVPEAYGLYSTSFSPTSGFSKIQNVEAQPGAAIVIDGLKQGSFYTCGWGDASYVKSYTAGKLSGKVEVPSQPCYIALDQSGRFIFSANIRGGTISLISLKADGSIDKLLQDLKIPPSKKKFSPHSVIPSLDNKVLCVADISGRRICVLNFDAAQGKISLKENLESEDFHGPRHLTFSLDGKFLYLINQMGGTVSVFSYKSGEFKKIQHILAFPAGTVVNKNHSASIEFHPNGKFLYCSNRGPDNLTLFHKDEESGRLKFIANFPSGGQAPWSFKVSVDGKYLFSSNRKSNNLLAYKIDPKTGALTPTGKELTIPAPASVTQTK